MIAYKAFEKGLICRDYQFEMGMNKTSEANCAKNGFHCAENPFDCLSYYGDIKNTEFYIVDALGDIDEDALDSKIACTELNILKKLTLEDFFLHGLAFMVNRPLRKWSTKVSVDKDSSKNGYVIVRGYDPIAKGSVGDILAFAKEDALGENITHIAMAKVGENNILPDMWYGADLTLRKVVTI